MKGAIYTLKELLQKDFLAMNGVISLQEVKEIVKLLDGEEYYYSKVIKGNSLSDIEKILKIFQEIDDEMREILSRNKISIISDLFNAIIESNYKKRCLLVIDLTDMDTYRIAVGLSIIKDIYKKSELMEVINILFIGNWGYELVEEEYKKYTGTSFPFCLDRNYIYCCQISFYYDEYLYFQKKYVNLNEEIWSLVIDYTKGEIFSTMFLLERVMQYPFQIDTYEKFVLSVLCDYYKIYYSKINEIIIKVLENKQYVSSFIAKDLDEEDILLRSNLFCDCNIRSGRRIVLKPYNYFSEYSIYRIASKTNCEIYSPKLPYLNIYKQIYSDIMEIESDIKQSLRLFCEHGENSILLFVPLYAEIIRKDKDINLKLASCKSLLEEIQRTETKYWRDEDPSYDTISVLTFGQIITFIEQIKNSYKINENITIYCSNEITCFDKSKKIIGSQKSIPLSKDSAVSILENYNGPILTYLESNEIRFYYLLPLKEIDRINDFLSRNKNCTNFTNRNKIERMGILNDYENGLEAIKEIHRYRNAIAHLKGLSPDALKKFSNIKNKFYSVAADRSTV